MPADLSHLGPDSLVRELLRLSKSIAEHDRRREIEEARYREIRDLLSPLFPDPIARYFHGEYSKNVVVVQQAHGGLNVRSVDLEWLHSLEFPNAPQPPEAPVPIVAHAVTDDNDD